MALRAISILSLPERLFYLPSRLHDDWLVFATERHAELAQEREGKVVPVRRRDERDVHPVDLLDHVVVDLGKNHLLLDAQAVVAPAVERACVHAAEIADSRN